MIWHVGMMLLSTVNMLHFDAILVIITFLVDWLSSEYQKSASGKQVAEASSEWRCDENRWWNRTVRYW